MAQLSPFSSADPRGPRRDDPRFKTQGEWPANAFASVLDVAFGWPAPSPSLKEILSRILSAHERERKRAAEEIHEGLAQNLVATNMELSAALREAGQRGLPRQTVNRLDAAMRMLQEAVSQVRSIQERLWPLMVGELGPASAILARCRRYRESYPGVKIETSFAPDGDSVPDHLGIGIYRVVEEFLEGIRRPAPGILVRLTLMVNAGRVSLTMTVQDESRARGGRHSPNPLDTVTLELIRRRVEILGGLSFVAAKGSEVQLRAMWDTNRGSSP